MTNIDIISGFLGAGKTTFIKKLLENGNNEKTVIIENEFGEIGIDTGFLKEAGVEITEMNSGCICCSLVGDFKEALLKVCRELSPDRIIIEPSGVGKLSDVIEAVKGAENGEFALRSATAVVDANKCKMHIKNFGEFFINQIENANAIILSHSENISEEKLEGVLALLREHNEKAEIVSTHYSLLSSEVLMKAMTSGKDELEERVIKEHHHHHEHHHHDGECHCHGEGHEHHHHDGECHCHGEGHEHHHHDGECHCHGEGHEHHHHDGECHCHGEGHEHHHHDGECCCHGEGHEHHHHDGECHCHGHHHHHDADEVFQSVGLESSKSFTKEKIDSVLSALESGDYGFILRAKGYLKGEEGFIHFDYIPEEKNVRYGDAMPTGRICVIGTDLKKEEIISLWEN